MQHRRDHQRLARRAHTGKLRVVLHAVRTHGDEVCTGGLAAEYESKGEVSVERRDVLLLGGLLWRASGGMRGEGGRAYPEDDGVDVVKARGVRVLGRESGLKIVRLVCARMCGRRTCSRC